MSDTAKDVIYVDVEDEITSLIDKVKNSDKKVVALVLPKRAAVLQSIVNMKLLKRAGDGAKKNLVLITSEAGLMPLAGSVGLYVAKTLQSKPLVPSAPQIDDSIDNVEEPIDVEDASEFDVASNIDKPIGELAGVDAAETGHNLPKDEAMDLGEIAAGSAVLDTAASKAKSAKKAKKDKRLRIPNFILFRRILILGGIGLVGLIILFIILGKTLPKATVTVQTNNAALKINLTSTIDPSIKTVDTSASNLPAQQQQKQVTNSAQSATTGQQNNGQKASGTVTMSAGSCSASLPSDVPAGSGLSSGGLTFLTQNDTSFTPAISHGKCTFQATGPTTVAAQQGGSSYNIAPTSFSVAGRSDVTASSNETFTGGTDSIVKIVAQADVDSAKSKITGQSTDQVKSQLEGQITQAGLIPVPASFGASNPNISVTPNVGTQADNVTVTQNVTYTMLGVTSSDLKALVDNNIQQQINSSQQSIVNDGANQVSFTQVNNNQYSIQTSAIVGTKIDINQLKPTIAGKKSGDIQSVIKQYPGVTDVKVQFSPFWVSSSPKNVNKITVIIKNANGSSA